ncbi:hypothetical protein HNQ77_001517 [Silvibacterium bohemicum]|uniref:Uncharacterized protein n=1 Tax=Silvibacterium bohemicum TaxID=1577686 RepID=A0A841JYQ7_9BACT|nr:hypothetical protein [Silvibacterium bohemicum]MBB6143568.1 hypothetical protein [Silvibacterium bohemicum]
MSPSTPVDGQAVGKTYRLSLHRAHQADASSTANVESSAPGNCLGVSIFDPEQGICRNENPDRDVGGIAGI